MAGTTVTLTYTVYSANNVCSNFATTGIVVDAIPAVPTPGTYGPVCENGSPVTLVGSPAGGVWSGNGVSGTGPYVFTPTALMAGTTVTLTYTVYSANNVCSNFATTGIVVDAIPSVPAPGTYGQVCENGSP